MMTKKYAWLPEKNFLFCLCFVYYRKKIPHKKVIEVKLSDNNIALDNSSLRILEILQENAEITNTELAERVGLSPSPCWRRVAEMREKGIIKGAVMLVDPIKLDLAVNVFINVTLQRQDKETLDQFTQAIAIRPEVMECYLMTGEADFLLRVVIKDLMHYQKFMLNVLTKIPGVSNIRSSFSLEQVKYTTSLPIQSK